MRSCRLVAVFVLMGIPVVATAQRSPNLRGERVGDVGGRGFQMPRASDLEDHSPVAIVIDRKKKLALTDSQVTALKEIAKALHEKNADFYRMWDSVRVSMRSASGGTFGGSAAAGGTGGTSAADAERLATARNRMQAIMRPLREGDEWAQQETLKVLNDDQKAKAEQFWKDDAEDFRGGLTGGGGRPPGA